MKSLQNQYNLIKEGKGNKEIFLKEAKAQFPQYISNVQTFDQVIHSLTEKGIINEMVLVSAKRPETPDWFKIFKENTESVKADLKDTDKSVTEKETAGYDYKAKNNNNISTAEMLKGYYAEMKDPKNAEKTEDEIKAIVVKNLEKDPLFYVKNGEFGIKGLGYTENHPGLGPTKEVTGKYKSSGMEPVNLNEAVDGTEYKRKVLPNKVKGVADTIDIKSSLEKLAPEVWGEPDFEKAKEKFTEFVKASGINDVSKKQMLFKLSTINNKVGLDRYLANSLLNYEKLGVKEGEGSSTHPNKTKGHEIDELDVTGIAGSEEEDDVRQGVKGIRTPKHETLSEAKKRAIEKHIAEIEKMGEVAAWDHRISKVQEKIEELTNKMTVTEGDDVKDMVDKKAVKELKKDIALLSKKKALYEKQKAKAAKRVKDKSVMQTAAGENTTVMEEKEKEKPFTPPADPDRDRIFASMKRDTAPKPKKESWSGMVRELINAKNLKLK